MFESLNHILLDDLLEIIQVFGMKSQGKSIINGKAFNHTYNKFDQVVGQEHHGHVNYCHHDEGIEQGRKYVFQLTK